MKSIRSPLRRSFLACAVVGLALFARPVAAQTEVGASSGDTGDADAALVVPIESPESADLYAGAAGLLTRGTGFAVGLQMSRSATWSVVGGVGSVFLPDGSEPDIAAAPRRGLGSQVAEAGGMIENSLPVAFALPPARPSPFRTSTAIAFELPRDSQVELVAYDLRGRHVRSIAAGSFPAGRLDQAWRGDDDAGRGLSAGVYFVVLVARDDAGALLARQVQKVVRLP